MQETASHQPKTLVVHPELPRGITADIPLRSASAQLEEAVGLAAAIALNVEDAQIVRLQRITPATLIGSGKVQELAERIKEREIGLTVVNTHLSPTQQRNLEKKLGSKVIDRTALILEIFGARARTHEGKLQVELASLNYQKSRLVRSWTHLERQRGGFGFMGGPGETQIEVDRRMIAERIDAIKLELEKVVRTRDLHRSVRRDVPFPTVALVGYTNAGKSTLFNRLTHASVMAEDRLFATLDPTIRRLKLPSGLTVMLSDTVGFISELPHELVAAFRATLEEVREADLILHVRDISHADSEAQAADVGFVLRELLGKELAQKPMLTVANKADLLSSEAASMASSTQPLVFVSALTGSGCEQLLDMIDEILGTSMFTPRQLCLNANEGELLAWCYRNGQVLARDTDEEGRLTLTLRLSDSASARLDRMALG